MRHHHPRELNRPFKFYSLQRRDSLLRPSPLRCKTLSNELARMTRGICQLFPMPRARVRTEFRPELRFCRTLARRHNIWEHKETESPPMEDTSRTTVCMFTAPGAFFTKTFHPVTSWRQGSRGPLRRRLWRMLGLKLPAGD